MTVEHAVRSGPTTYVRCRTCTLSFASAARPYGHTTCPLGEEISPAERYTVLVCPQTWLVRTRGRGCREGLFEEVI